MISMFSTELGFDLTPVTLSHIYSKRAATSSRTLTKWIMNLFQEPVEWHVYALYSHDVTVDTEGARVAIRVAGNKPHEWYHDLIRQLSCRTIPYRLNKKTLVVDGAGEEGIYPLLVIYDTGVEESISTWEERYCG